MKIKDYARYAALAVCAVIAFTQCAEQSATQTTPPTVSSDSSAVSQLSIAYINIDSLLISYNFAQDMNDALLRKQENLRANLNERRSKLEKEAADFQRKLQNNAFLTQDRARQEQERILKLQDEFNSYGQQKESELMMEQQKMIIQMNDSITLFIKEYNANMKYQVILNNSSALFIDPQFDITGEVIELLNKRYKPAK